MLTSLINTPPKPIVDHYKKHPTPMLTIEFYKKNIHQCSLVSSTWEECTHGHSCSHITITHVFLPTPNVCGLSESFHLPLRTSSGQHARLVGQLHPYQSVVPPLHPTPHKPISPLPLLQLPCHSCLHTTTRHEFPPTPNVSELSIENLHLALRT
jgi:hypothetical protein